MKKKKSWLWQEAEYLLTPHEIPILLFVFSLIILALSTAAWSIIFYAAVTALVLLTAHFLHTNKHRPHEVITILATFFLPAIFTFIAFRDWFSIILIVLYTLSAISTAIIHHHHKKKHNLVKVMWHVTYSKFVAATITLFGLLIFAQTLPSYYMSTIEMIAVVGLPLSIIFFFLSKYLYLQHFDKKHWKHDIWLSARHAIIYGLAFMLITSCFYALSAVQITNQKLERLSQLQETSMILAAKESNVLADEDLLVYKELDAYNIQLQMDMQKTQSDIEGYTLNFGDIMDDTYMQELLDLTLTEFEEGMKSAFLLDAKETADKTRIMIDETLDHNRTFPDGSPDLKTYAENLKRDVEEKYTPFYLDLDQVKTLMMIDDPAVSVEEFENSGLNWLFSEQFQIDSMYNSTTLVGMELMNMLKRTQIERIFSAANYKIMLIAQRQATAGYIEQELYSNRYLDEDDMSKAIRYSIIKYHIQKNDPLAFT